MGKTSDYRKIINSFCLNNENINNNSFHFSDILPVFFHFSYISPAPWLLSFHYSHIMQNSPATGGHVFSTNQHGLKESESG